MDIKYKAMGDYATNCYIVSTNGMDFIIDPGIDATSWVLQNVKNPVAILNTHGHFDHVWSNAQLQQKLKIPLYTPINDIKMLKESSWFKDLPPSTPDVAVLPNEEFDFNGVKVKFHHYPGHTEGCSVIEIGNVLFSGDFIFRGSIGRVDFPFSSPEEMKNSLKRFKKLEKDMDIYAGHGEKTTIKQEQQNIDYWLERL